jgi:flagellar basal-body rod protein FlgF
LAIAGEGYFKVLTPRGDRYTLDGSILINSDYVLVNREGMAFASRDNGPIILPPEVQDITVAQDGTVYANGDEVDIIGIFSFQEPGQLIKEGNSLYSSRVNDILLDEVTVVSGALRNSNVSSAKAITDMVELQRSSSLTNNLMSEIGDLERSVITKIAK